VRNELSPLQDRFREVNDWLGMEVIRFKEYTSTTRNNPSAASMAAFSYPPPSRLRRATRARPHPTTNEPTQSRPAPSRRAQTIIFIITHHLWRAMLSRHACPLYGSVLMGSEYSDPRRSGGSLPERATLTCKTMHLLHAQIKTEI
jgi:hypothetical protein